MKKVAISITITLLAGLMSCSHTGNKKTAKKYQNYKAISKYQEPSKNVNDWENILTDVQKSQLDSIIRNFEINTTNQVILVTVKDASPYKTIEDFGKDLRTYWENAAPGNRCDLIIAFSAKMRNVWIGTQGEVSEKLNNKMVKQVINNYMLPQFKRQDYFGGLRDGLLACMSRWSQK